MTAVTPAYAPCISNDMSMQDACRHIMENKLPSSAKPQARYPCTFPMIVPQHVKEAMISEDGPFFQTGGTRVVDGETLAGWGVISRSHHGRIDITFGPVVTTEAHLAFSGARAHSNNTAEMTAMIEALSFFGPHGPVTRDEQSCIF